MEDWKIKISALWLNYAMALSAYMTIGILMPGVLSDLVNEGTMSGLTLTPEVLLAMAVLLLVPLLMAFAALVLKDSINRWANIIAGIVFFILELLELTDLTANPSAALALIWVWKTVVPLLIIWYAWKPKQKAQT